jgi:hypothetical protein
MASTLYFRSNLKINITHTMHETTCPPRAPAALPAASPFCFSASFFFFCLSRALAVVDSTAFSTLVTCSSSSSSGTSNKASDTREHLTRKETEHKSKQHDGKPHLQIYQCKRTQQQVPASQKILQSA